MYNVPEKLVKLIDVLYEYAIPLIPCRTKSGGLHLYLFLRSFTPAERVKQALENIVRIFAIDKLFTDSTGNCHTEVFPLQTTVSSKKKRAYYNITLFQCSWYSASSSILHDRESTKACVYSFLFRLCKE